MSHECPECGQTCYCNGDVDDCCFNLPRYQMKCVHWKKCNPFDEDNEDYEITEKED